MNDNVLELINRIKVEQQHIADTSTKRKPDILNRLKDAIEKHFLTLHSPADYAGLLNDSTAALNKLSKTHFNKTLSSLITGK